MFQSSHRLGSYHAAARSISNCPIYITDYPNSHDFSVLKKCIIRLPSIMKSKNLQDKILRSRSPALPSLSNLFFNPKEIDKLLKIINFNGYNNNNIGVVGFWNCRNVRVIDTFCLNEIFSIKDN